MEIIALIGYPGAGKTSVSRYLASAGGYHRTRFAAPLKAMLRSLGLNDDHIDGHLKEQPCALLGGQTPRWAMQSLGTEWGRDLIHPDLWIILWRAEAEKHEKVVVDDLRFPNEAKMLRELGAQIWRIERPGAVAYNHVSEQHIQSIIAHRTIVNDGTPAQLQRKVLDSLWTRHS